MSSSTSIVTTVNESSYLSSLLERYTCKHRVCQFFVQLVSWEPVQSIVTLMSALYHGYILRPLFRLYLLGPSVYGLGGWKGRPEVEICAEITNVPIKHWNANIEVCQDLIVHNFSTFMAIFETGILLILWWQLLSLLTRGIQHFGSFVLIQWQQYGKKQKYVHEEFIDQPVATRFYLK